MVRNRALIKGIVQGIGFRPYIYNLAQRWQLVGFIRNNSIGVEIEVEGEESSVEHFFEELKSNSLQLAEIYSIERSSVPLNFDEKFEIRDSEIKQNKFAFIPPDMSICDDCLRELFDPADHRYCYPFINCTNCGPRYTIIRDVPYDRPKTSMANFKMCAECSAEYHDPKNRRFHAQPNACPKCGPKVELFDGNQNLITTNDAVLETIQLLKKGAIVAVKGLGGFHLAVDAENDTAVQRLRQRKFREEKPLALMALNLEKVKSFADISNVEKKQLLSSRKPIVLLRKKIPNSIAESVAPKNSHFGVMLPYTPLHYLLLKDDFLALVMTSGNMTDEPICIDNDEAFQRLKGIADYFLIHDRDIYQRCDDSILRVVGKKSVMIRRARGYVPQPILLEKNFPQILACGAELKNTICLTKEHQAILSQHIGDLKTEDSYQFFLKTIDHLKKLFDINPELIAYDLHPEYLCTKYALEQECSQKIGVQHHHAHILSCIAEHGLDEPVLGIAFDGTGYGEDGKIWGGELFWVDGVKFVRMAHFEYLPMPGGDMAIKEPWRMALSGLFIAFGEDFLEMELPAIKKIPSEKLQFILEMIKKNVNCPQTSSMGRIFDLVSSLLNVCQRATYEGQPAIMLEQHATNEIDEFLPYEFAYQHVNGRLIFDSKLFIRQIVFDLLEGERSEIIATKFHRTIIELVGETTSKLARQTKTDKIVLSGGVFQNIKLLKGLHKKLSNMGLQVYFQEKVPTNDGGISLGQAEFGRRFVKE